MKKPMFTIAIFQNDENKRFTAQVYDINNDWKNEIANAPDITELLKVCSAVIDSFKLMRENTWAN